MGEYFLKQAHLIQVFRFLLILHRLRVASTIYIRWLHRTRFHTILETPVRNESILSRLYILSDHATVLSSDMEGFPRTPE